MPKDLFILDKAYTFQASARLLARAILSIDDENEKTVFSIADILCLLRAVNAHVPGEFNIQRTHSHYYKFEDEVIVNFSVGEATSSLRAVFC